ncbi:hypothetical protein BSLG_006730 [Batrachochytrium salamandrivorans]|nr:hypothetical protein BSLG_006730 [Batrachochytrium salamandrivorans]
MLCGEMANSKNATKGYSDLQIKTRQATCNDPWGPSGSLMAEISSGTHNHRDFIEVMEIIDKRMNDSGKNWRHVFKALTVLDYLIKNGPETVITHARQNLHVIKTLKEFQYIDDEGRDQGANVRQKSKDITSLLNDDSLLQEMRNNQGRVRSRSNQNGDGDIGGDTGAEDIDLRRALEESKQQAAEDNRRRKEREQEEIDIQRAIELSENDAIQRRMDARNRLEPQVTGDSTFSGHNPRGKDIIDFFGSLEQPAAQPFQQQAAFDPFAAFGTAQNPFGSFGANGPVQPINPSSAAPDLSRNPKPLLNNHSTGGSSGFNPFGSSSPQPSQSSVLSTQKPLFDLDASSLSSSSVSQPVGKNPFSTSNSSRYQWDDPKAKPTLSQLQATNAFSLSSAGVNGLSPGQTNAQGFRSVSNRFSTSIAPLQPTLTGTHFNNATVNPFNTSGGAFNGQSMQPVIAQHSGAGVPGSSNAFSQQPFDIFSTSNSAPFGAPFSQQPVQQQQGTAQFQRANNLI